MASNALFCFDIFFLPKISRRLAWLLPWLCLPWLGLAQIDRTRLQEKFPTVNAVHISRAVELDGILSEPEWQMARPATGFVQKEPEEGARASEKTEVKFLFTLKMLYVGIHCMDSEPDAIVANEMQRDGALYNDDSVVVLLDTFGDRRNAYFFETNPNGAKTDMLSTDEGRDTNAEWDGVWWSKATRCSDGWTAEMAIPFSSLKFDPQKEWWGLNIRRMIRRKNETVFWSPIPLGADLFRMSLAGHLTGLEELHGSVSVQVKPFVAASMKKLGQTRDRGGDLGGDITWGITRNMSIDLTFNTDFAEAEVDRQEVNLTRFSLFFPEKREFFLENAGIFEIASNTVGTDPPLLNVFFSRRIGIASTGEQVPISWGAKLTGRASGWNIGVLDIETESMPLETGEEISRNNWGVLRLQKNIGRRSGVGMILTNRDGEDGDFNRVYGLDANIRPNDHLTLNGFWTESRDAQKTFDDHAGGVAAKWEGKIWDWNLGATDIGEQFNPEMGFLLRSGVRRYTQRLSFAPRPKSDTVLYYYFSVMGDAYYDDDNRLETLNVSGDLFALRFKNDAALGVWGSYKEEWVDDAFQIGPEMLIAPGEYQFGDVGIWGETPESLRYQAEVFVSNGRFFSGDRFSASLAFKTRPSRYFSSSTSYEFNRVSLPDNALSINVLRQRFDVKLSPDLLVSSFFQLNDLEELATLNLRFNWIYRPGADVYLVYNQTWDAAELSHFDSRDRQVIFKFSYIYQN